jgi:aminopeptidase N
MPPTGRNLTRVAARERAGLVEVSRYDITLDLTADAATAATFVATTTVSFRCTEPGATVVIDVAAERLISARLNGVPVSTDQWSPALGLALPDLAAENELSVVGDFGYNTGARGMVRTTDPADGEVYLYTSYEPASAQLVFACFDQPDLKATFTFHVRVPEGWRAISNMPEDRRDPGPEDTTTVHFAQTPRMSTYLAVVAAGPFTEVRDQTYGRDLGIFCRPSMVAHLDAAEVFDITRRGMDFFEKQFGQPYPLPKYDHVAVPGYPGAMENFGCITFGERLLIFRSVPTVEQRTQRAMVILHELAHMWFGDLVTMRWWDDLWLNEAFATWAAYWSMAEATEFPEPWAGFALDQKLEGIEADQLSSTHPVCADIPDVEATETNFDAITYRKGASVLKQLAAYVGIDPFTAALRGYFADRAWGNATFDDLLGALVAASGKPVREFATVWLNTPQVNTLRPVVELDTDGRYTAVSVAQEAPAEHPTLRTHRIAIGLYDLDGDDLLRRERVELDVTGERTDVPTLRGLPAADVLLVNDDDLTYAKVRLDQRSLSTVLSHIQGFPSALPRSICWMSAVDMVSDAEMRARDLVTLAVSGLPAEQSPVLVGLVLAASARALELYADPQWAPQGWSALSELCRARAYVAEPGSPLQLTWVRAYATSVRTPAEVASLADWYAGTEVPPGLILDDDLRWQLLQSLVRAGGAGEAEIQAESDRDRSVGGARHAMVARSMTPDPEQRAAAWARIVEDSGAPMENRLHSAFWYASPSLAAVTPTHVTDYLSILDRLWTEQGREIGRNLARLAFPRGQVDPATLDAIDAWVAEGEHPATLVRAVTEGRDQIVRALAARARDRG